MTLVQFILSLFTCQALIIANNRGVVVSGCDDLSVAVCLSPLLEYNTPEMKQTIGSLDFSLSFLNQLCAVGTTAHECMSRLDCGTGSTLGFAKSYYDDWKIFDSAFLALCSNGLLLFQENYPCWSNALVRGNVTSCVASYLLNLSTGWQCSILEPTLDNCIYDSSKICGSRAASLMVDIYKLFRTAQMIKTSCIPTISATTTSTTTTLPTTTTTSPTTTTTTTSPTTTTTVKVVPGVVEGACDDGSVIGCILPLAPYKDAMANIMKLNFNLTLLNKICTLGTTVNKCLEPLQCGSGSSLSFSYYQDWITFKPIFEFMCSKGKQLFQGAHPCLPNPLLTDNVTSCIASYLSGLSNGSQCSILEPGIDNCIYNSSAVCGSSSASLMVDLLRLFRMAQIIKTPCTPVPPTTEKPAPAASFAVGSTSINLGMFISTLSVWLCLQT